MKKDLPWFNRSLKDEHPPEGLSPYLKSLWYDGKGDWELSHDIAQDLHDKNGSLIHAYLHRKEGDKSNANYWYQKAGRTYPGVSIDSEWEMLVEEFLSL